MRIHNTKKQVKIYSWASTLINPHGQAPVPAIYRTDFEAAAAPAAAAAAPPAKLPAKVQEEEVEYYEPEKSKPEVYCCASSIFYH